MWSSDGSACDRLDPAIRHSKTSTHATYSSQEALKQAIINSVFLIKCKFHDNKL